MDFLVTTSDGRDVVLTLNAESLAVGDILIFDGDVVHRGCAYRTTIVAAHIYLDVEGVQRVQPNEVGSFWPICRE